MLPSMLLITSAALSDDGFRRSTLYSPAGKVLSATVNENVMLAVCSLADCAWTNPIARIANKPNIKKILRFCFFMVTSLRSLKRFKVELYCCLPSLNAQARGKFPHDAQIFLM